MIETTRSHISTPASPHVGVFVFPASRTTMIARTFDQSIMSDKEMDYILTLEKDGIHIPREYSDLVGFAEGDRFEISIGISSIKLKKIDEDADDDW